MRTRAEGRRSEQSERRWDHRRWVAQRLRSNQSLSPPFCDFDNLRQVEKMRSWVTDFDIQKLFPVSLRMNVSLTDKLEDFVNELVEQGRYRSASEVVWCAKDFACLKFGKPSLKARLRGMSNQWKRRRIESYAC